MFLAKNSIDKACWKKTHSFHNSNFSSMQGRYIKPGIFTNQIRRNILPCWQGDQIICSWQGISPLPKKFIRWSLPLFHEKSSGIPLFAEISLANGFPATADKNITIFPKKCIFFKILWCSNEGILLTVS